MSKATVAPLPVPRTTVPKPLERDDWLAVRRPYFGASSAAVLFDRHPYQTPGDLAAVKLTGREPAQTRAMARGIRLEDVIARWWADEHADVAVDVDVLYVAGPMMATVDRWAQGDDCPIEIKTTSIRSYEPQPYWLDQCQAIMLCADAPVIWLVWFDPSMDIHEQMVVANPSLQAEMLQRAERFMAAIELGIVPDWIELSYDNVVALHPAPTGHADIGDVGLSLVRQLDAVRQVRLDAEKAEAALKDELAALLGNREAGTWNGLEVVSFRAVKGSTVFDRHMFAADHPDLAEKYMVERPGSRRMIPKLEATF